MQRNKEFGLFAKPSYLKNKDDAYMQATKKIGFTCAYTPLPIIDAAGYVPYRILPMTEVPDQAGQLLHDNLCPNIKRILDRAISNDLPDLAGAVFVNSCDAMRRMTDAWQEVRKDKTDSFILLDLPATADDLSISFFKSELIRLAETLGKWRGEKIDPALIAVSIDKFNKITRIFQQIAPRFRKGYSKEATSALQNLYNQASTNSIDNTIARLEKIKAQPEVEPSGIDGVPVYLFGNVMCDPEAFAMIESCGAIVANDDFCTGSRMFSSIPEIDSDDVYLRLARALLTKPPCARTFDPAAPGKIAEDLLKNARACQARGVIGHTVKFCDPYLERLPVIRETFKNAGIPLLLLEGDCTLRSMGQQKTRIEAFIEMLR